MLVLFLHPVIKPPANPALFPKLRVHCPFYTRAPIHPRVIPCSHPRPPGEAGVRFPFLKCLSTQMLWFLLSLELGGRSGRLLGGGGPETRKWGRAPGWRDFGGW